ncbi:MULTISPECIES: fimbrial protein [unclassified Photobacterium]|uniref:fimbrial protein n=1 Tax=unclassified Photobacterium TaxID=2628852 RepID=UPI001EDF285B|nr:MULTISPECIES: fimbrial protein [unclassified Photobacterium]MCG3862984.1 type 1 fimbrial protein [Photobacterium sp. Ph6]MCG3874515.1 type 1 fimbrial protein [Photobacterium sp. Ph5]
MNTILFTLVFLISMIINVSHADTINHHDIIYLKNRCIISVSQSEPTIDITGKHSGDIVGHLSVTYQPSCTVTGVIKSYYRYFEIKDENSGLFTGNNNEMYFSNNKNFILKLSSPLLNSENKSAIINSSGYFPYISWFNIFHLDYNDTINNTFDIILNNEPLLIRKYNNNAPRRIIAIAATATTSGYIHYNDFVDLDDQTINGSTPNGTGNIPNIYVNIINNKPVKPTCDITPININLGHISLSDINNHTNIAQQHPGTLRIFCQNTQTQNLTFIPTHRSNISTNILTGYYQHHISPIGFKMSWQVKNGIHSNNENFRFNTPYLIAKSLTANLYAAPVILDKHATITAGYISATMNMVVNYE